jgi:uncharacterized membrane protein
MKKAIWISMVLIVLQTIVAVIIFPMLPELIPMNWGIDGEINSWGSKTMIFMSPAISLGIVLLLSFLPKIDPLGKNVLRAEKAYGTIIVATVALMTVVFALTAKVSLGKNMLLPVETIIMVSVGILFVIIGNYLPKAKRNFIFGIRLPWTLLNDEVWVKTHRLGGKIFMLMGVPFLFGWLMPTPYNFIVPMAGIFAGVFITAVYAYKTYKKVAEPLEK